MKTVFLVTMFIVLTCGICLAQVQFSEAPARIQPAAEKPVEPVIFVGQAVDEALAVLKAHNITASDLPFPFPSGGREYSFLGFTLDPDGINAQVFYTNATRRVTSIAILFQPIAGAEKSSEAWVSTVNIRLNKDRTFDIRFAPPLEPEYETSAPASNKQVAAVNKSEALLYVGQELTSAEEILRSKKIKFGSGGRDIMMTNPDLDEYSFGLDRQHGYGDLTFSKTTKKLTSLGAVFVPAQKQSYKLNQSHVSIQALRFNQDGSYEMRFTAPLTEAERRERDRQWANRKDVYPTKPVDEPVNSQSFTPAPPRSK